MFQRLLVSGWRYLFGMPASRRVGRGIEIRKQGGCIFNNINRAPRSRPLKFEKGFHFTCTHSSKENLLQIFRRRAFENYVAVGVRFGRHHCSPLSWDRVVDLGRHCRIEEKRYKEFNRIIEKRRKRNSGMNGIDKGRRGKREWQEYRSSINGSWPVCYALIVSSLKLPRLCF